jgi:hypothetical protein
VEDMEAAERNAIYVKELGMPYGCAWSALKKSWRQLKYCLKIGDFERVETLKARTSHIRWAWKMKNFIEFRQLSIIFYTFERNACRL